MSRNWILIISSALILPFNLLIFGIGSSNFGAGNVFLFGCIFYWLYISLVLLLLNKEGSSGLIKLVSSGVGFRRLGLLEAAAFLPAVSAFFVVFLPNIKSLTLLKVEPVKIFV